jgi:hypothetical protein
MYFDIVNGLRCFGEANALAKVNMYVKGSFDMRSLASNYPSRATFSRSASLLTSLFAASALVLAQDPLDSPPPAAPPTSQQPAQPLPTTGGWRRVGSASQTSSATNAIYNAGPASLNDQQYPQNGQGSNEPNQNQPYPNQPYPNQPAYGQQGLGQAGNNQQNYNPPPPVPAHLTMKPGTYITVRMNQPLSSDTNQTGDAFTAALSKPIVVDGVVVAGPGQIVTGRVSEALKAGHGQGTSHLGLQLTNLTLVDGEQVPIQSGLVTSTGPGRGGRDAATLAATTATGAAIGAAVGWGVGAAIGAGAGFTAGVIGVLATRGQPTVVYPEQELTFALAAPLGISTEQAPTAFRWIDPNDYAASYQGQGPPQQGQPQAYASAPAYNYGYPTVAPYYSPYYYGYGYPYSYWPSVGLYFGTGYYGGYYGRGYYGGYYGRGYYGGRPYYGGGNVSHYNGYTGGHGYYGGGNVSHYNAPTAGVYHGGGYAGGSGGYHGGGGGGGGGSHGGGGGGGGHH